MKQAERRSWALIVPLRQSALQQDQFGLPDCCRLPGKGAFAGQHPAGQTEGFEVALADHDPANLLLSEGLCQFFGSGELGERTRKIEIEDWFASPEQGQLIALFRNAGSHTRRKV